MPKRILVTGGRYYADRDWIWNNLSELHRDRGPFEVLIHGNYGKTDLTADAWARENGVMPIPVDAEWDRLGPKAGPIRNQIMVDRHRPDIVVGFKGNAGTTDCLRRALRAGLDIIVVPPREA